MEDVARSVVSPPQVDRQLPELLFVAAALTLGSFPSTASGSSGCSRAGEVPDLLLAACAALTCQLSEWSGTPAKRGEQQRGAAGSSASRKEEQLSAIARKAVGEAWGAWMGAESG